MDLITAALGVLASCSVVHKKAKACKKSTFLEFFYSTEMVRSSCTRFLSMSEHYVLGQSMVHA